MDNIENLKQGTELVKRGFAKMQKGGVIMDVVNAEQAKIAEEAGAVAVMALEAVPAEVRRRGGVARMAPVEVNEEIMDDVSIPVMGKVRIGHTVESQILETLGIDMVDESEVLTPADEQNHIDKTEFDVPFVCGARDLGEALRRIDEGAAMIRTKGEAGTGDVAEAVKHTREIKKSINELKGMDKKERRNYARKIEAPIALVEETAEKGRLPVVNFAAGGIATPADAALMMQLGCDGIFVGSGIFEAENPEKMGKAIVEAVNNYDNPEELIEVAKNTGLGMKGKNVSELKEAEQLQYRGN